jgi:olefin beta-lactone synthetase
LTYAELEARSDQFARILHQSGIRPGCKTVLMIPPGLDLYTMVFAMFKVGAVPIVVDPGMGIKRLLHSYQSVQAEAFVGITIANLVRMATPQYFPLLKSIVWMRNGQLHISQSNPAYAASDDAALDASGPYPIAPTLAHQLGMINFTTGSTGPAKAVLATYGMAMAMVGMIQAHFGLTPDDRELVTLPFLGVVALSIGCTMVIPVMNPGKPAAVVPQNIIDAISNHQITTMFASPALLDRVGRYANLHGIKLPTLRCVNCGGAPVTLATLASFNALLAGKGRFFSTYGATEGLPLASISADELLADAQTVIRQGHGTPIGHPFKGVSIRIIGITDAPLPDWNERLLVKPGEVGEIVVSGPNISQGYYADPAADAAHKIREQQGGDSVLWHRTGDLAWQDADGRFIFAGRMSHRVLAASGEVLFSVSCEGVSNSHAKVQRSALVGVNLGAGVQPVMCIELKARTSVAEKKQIEQEILALLHAHRATQNIHTILFHPAFPVDLRHNAKIERPQLALWADHVLKQTPGQKKQALVAKLIPILGWLYILLGLVITLPTGVWTWIWYIDLFLSVVVHGLQIFVGIPIGKMHGISRGQAALQTFIFGATWWKPLRIVADPKAGREPVK